MTMVAWGLVTTLTSLVDTYEGLLVLGFERFDLRPPS